MASPPYDCAYEYEACMMPDQVKIINSDFYTQKTYFKRFPIPRAVIPMTDKLPTKDSSFDLFY